MGRLIEGQSNGVSDLGCSFDTGNVTMRGLCVMIVGAALLGGCTEVPVPAGMAAGLGVLAFQSTKKLPPIDHLATAIVGRDCSVIHFEQTGDYCPKISEVDRSNVYCYRTLGGVDCHELPDPYRNGNRALGSPPPNRVETGRMADF